MKEHVIKINWKGPHKADSIIKNMNNGGGYPDYNGPDYGVYQIYGNHILGGNNTLLYIGQAMEQTFSKRFRQHKKEWLSNEKNIKIYLGRIDGSPKYTKNDNWAFWKRDVDIAESIVIYKYSPNYNSSKIGALPEMFPYKSIVLVHSGEKNKLKQKDITLKDCL